MATQTPCAGYTLKTCPSHPSAGGASHTTSRHGSTQASASGSQASSLAAQSVTVAAYSQAASPAVATQTPCAGYTLRTCPSHPSAGGASQATPMQGSTQASVAGSQVSPLAAQLVTVLT